MNGGQYPRISIALPTIWCIFVLVFFGARWNSSTGGKARELR